MFLQFAAVKIWSNLTEMNGVYLPLGQEEVEPESLQFWRTESLPRSLHQMYTVVLLERPTWLFFAVVFLTLSIPASSIMTVRSSDTTLTFFLLQWQLVLV